MVKYITVICRPPGTDRQEVIDYSRLQAFYVEEHVVPL